MKQQWRAAANPGFFEIPAVVHAREGPEQSGSSDRVRWGGAGREDPLARREGGLGGVGGASCVLLVQQLTSLGTAVPMASTPC